MACSGHGAAIDTPSASIEAALRRYEKWLDDPEKLGWHACKRIFTYALMIYDGMTASEAASYLLQSSWFHDYSRSIFRSEPADFIEPLLNEHVRSGAARWQDGRLVPVMAYNPPAPDWPPPGPLRPRDWPKIDNRD